MRELLDRLLSTPRLTVELMVASVFANVLALASPIFVMQVLNRYVAHGVDSTLATLIVGVLIAISLEFAFRQARMRLARGVSVVPDEYAAYYGFGVLTRAKTAAMEQIPAETRREIVNGVNAIEAAYGATNITTVLDVPFALLFVVVLYILEPSIALVVAGFLIAVFGIGLYGGASMRAKSAALQETSGAGSALLGTATREGDTVRAFNAGAFLRRAWREHSARIQGLRRDITARQGLIQTITQSANGLMSVAVIGLGATLVVAGKLDVGTMIGANILAARALQPISKFSQLGSAFAKAREALALFDKLSGVPLEPERGSALTAYAGGLELRDVAFAFPGSSTPLFESVNFELQPGSVLVVTGGNGTGKTTFARLLVGLLDPSRGQVLVDGLDLKQVAPEWWRRQIVYLPQEPALLNTTLEENLRINNPDIDRAALNRAIDDAGLRQFLDESPDGLETPILDNGWRLSEGMRRRIALARALTTDGMLVVIDEPTESLDADGCAAVHRILGELAGRGRTIVVMSHDPEIVRGPHRLLDLNVKPTPEMRVAGGVAPAQVAAEAADPDAPRQVRGRTAGRGATP